MTASQLKDHHTVTELSRIQTNLGLKDIPFSKTLRLDIHGANWGKIKAGNYDGNYSVVLVKLQVALSAYKNQGTGEAEEGIVILDHVIAAKTSVALSLEAEDEHRLTIIAGPRGSGKTRTLALLHSKHPGHFMSALPSWSGGYLNFLNKFSVGIGLGGQARSAGQAEDDILSYMAQSQGLICIDEFNYFSAAAINFLKSVLNSTKWAIACATVPHYLSRMASDRQTSQEAAQMLRRAVGIIHISPVTALHVDLIRNALYPHVDLGGSPGDIAAAANRNNRLDSVCTILADAQDSDNIATCIARHEKMYRVTVNPQSHE